MVIQAYLFRHGKTDYNQGKIWQGQLDIPLNAEGIRQAEQLRDALCREGIRFTHLLASDLRRAYQTAQIAADANCDGQPDVLLTLESDLRERDMGVLQGSSYEGIDPFAYTISVPDIQGGESLDEVLHRASAVPRKVLDCGEDSVVGIFAHGGINAMITAAFFDMPFDARACQLQNNGSYHYFRLSKQGALLAARLHCKD